MEIPYTISTRPDTGLWNAKIGIWLFLASEVMLFGGLFSAYVFLRLDARPGEWPHGLLNVPIGTMNTAVLIISSVTVVLAWAALKMRRYRAYWWYMLATICCGVIFLFVKLYFEWPQKFEHFGAFIKPEAREKYEQYLGNHRREQKGLEPRIEITGHLENHEALKDPNAREYEIALDPVFADPNNPSNDRPHFLYVPPTDKVVKIDKEYVERIDSFGPWHSAYFACYLTITLLSVALSYVDFGCFFSWLFHVHISPQTGGKLNIAVAIVVAAFKVSLVALIFMHLAAEKRLIYRVLIFTGFFVLGLFWLTFLAWYNPITR